MTFSSMRSILTALLLMALPGAVAQAQDQAPAPAPTAPAPDATAPAPAAPSQPLLKPEQLDQLVAPIALYPDALLAEVLMASTYPLEVVQADRWAKKNKSLKGDQLKAAVDQQTWDDSVKALVATPAALSMMSDQLDWTQKLGDAVLAQQPDVMDAVQRLRALAQANNKLVTTKEQKVTVVQQENRPVIVIEPAVPDMIYVPYYEPAVVYGVWGYPAYPPYYFPPPYGYYVPGAILATGIAFGAGYALGRWASGGNYWGGGVNWGNRNINVNRPVNINNINVGSGNNWQHNPAHRQGVKYSNPTVQQKFGNANVGAGSRGNDFRGRGGNQVLNPGGGNNIGGNRPGSGNIGNTNLGSGNRPGGGDKAGNKLGSGNVGGNKPGGGNVGGGNKPSVSNRSSAGGGRESLGGSGGGRGGASMGGRGGGVSMGGGGRGGGAAMRGGGGRGGGAAMRGGGGRGGGGGGGGRGGRRSDIQLKHDIALLGRLDNGLGFYRYSYNGSSRAYVGVMAQEVRTVMPEAVTVGRDGYLRVYYEKLGVKFQTYRHWLASGARIPSVAGTALRARHTANAS